MNLPTWKDGEPQLAAFECSNRNVQLAVYDQRVKANLLDDLVTLKVLARAADGRIIAQPNRDAPLAHLRENRGKLLVRHPKNKKTGAKAFVEVVATGRGTGRVE